jgi:hypothetical protein
LDLNLNSHSSTLDLESSQANGAASTAVRCRRCLSSSHSRRACTAPIKCYDCHEWGHIAASCLRQWQKLQDSVAGRTLPDFPKILTGLV